MNCGITLTFPDGTAVTPDRLYEWLEAVEEDPDTSEDDFAVACILVDFFLTELRGGV